MPSPSHVYFIT